MMISDMMCEETKWDNSVPAPDYWDMRADDVEDMIICDESVSVENWEFYFDPIQRNIDSDLDAVEQFLRDTNM